jgi:ubiquinone/menaquinone biosynthesis C-methylase UbiE
MYKEIAKSYDELHKEEQIKKLKIIQKNMKIIPPLLDIGCGTGISTNFFKVKSVGIDNCKEMIENGKGDLRYANAENLPFKDKTFNTIISVTAFQNINSMEKALKEAIRVSKNNNICITFLKKSKKINSFRKLFKKHFKNYKEIEEEKDIIFLPSF